jgi:hypothetical protein
MVVSLSLALMKNKCAEGEILTIVGEIRTPEATLALLF